MIKALMFALSFCVASQANAWTSWIGTLEDWPVPSSGDAKATVTYEARIRPLFYKIDGQKWKPAPKTNQPGNEVPLPKAISWDVCFGGRGEGSITAVLDEKNTNAAVPPYILRAEDHAPWRTRRSLDYAGWINEPVYKPILLSSSLNSTCKDPEKWRGGPGNKSQPYLPDMIALINKQLAFNPTPTTVIPTSAKIPHAWASPKGGRFALIKANTAAGESISATFYIGDKGPSFVGFNMPMIDAGDLDSAGTTKLVFKQRSEKQDIYALFIGGDKIAESVWDYP